MGIFSEAAAEGNAIALEKILKAGVATTHDDIIWFCKKHIYPLYETECGDTWGTKNVDPELQKIFKDVQNSKEDLDNVF